MSDNYSILPELPRLNTDTLIVLEALLVSERRNLNNLDRAALKQALADLHTWHRILRHAQKSMVLRGAIAGAAEEMYLEEKARRKHETPV